MIKQKLEINIAETQIKKNLGQNIKEGLLNFGQSIFQEKKKDMDEMVNIQGSACMWRPKKSQSTDKVYVRKD